MTQVYVVTVGEYDDYRIVAVYSTRAAAEARVAHIRAMNDCQWNAPGIEEYTLDPQEDA